MNYSLILSIALYICGCFYMVFGAVIIAINAKSKVNRMFIHLTSSLAIWSFSYSISTSVPTAEMSAFVRSFSAFGLSLIHIFQVADWKISSRGNAVLARAPR